MHAGTTACRHEGMSCVVSCHASTARLSHTSHVPDPAATLQDRVVQPDPQRHAEYQRHFQAYKALYPALKPGFHAAAGQQQQQQQGGAAPAPDAAAAANGSQRAVSKGDDLHSIVSPSILSADFANLARDVDRVVKAGACRAGRCG